MDEVSLEMKMELDDFHSQVGEYDIEVVKGAVMLYGAVLQPKDSPQRVYAPSTSALPQIHARQPDTVIRLSSVQSSSKKLAKLSPLFRESAAASATPLNLVNTADNDAVQRSLSVLEIDKEMEIVLRSLRSRLSAESPKPRMMAVGAKSSGKSTFNRVMCNYFQTYLEDKKCFYLDLDPGQPEFGPPGQLSLVEVSSVVLGPPYTHPASTQSPAFRLVRSHTIAATSLKDNPVLYRTCAADLIRQTNPHSPLIINSCGWVSGLGATMLTELVSLLAVTNIVLLEPVEEALRLSIRAASRSLMFHRLSRRTPKPSSRTPAETRAMQTMAYFHQRPSGDRALLRWSGKAIHTVRPWIVSYAGPQQGILAALSYGQSPSPEFLAEVLDGSVVAIVVLDGSATADNVFLNQEAQGIDEKELPHDIADYIEYTPEDLPYIKSDLQGISRSLNPSASHCIGLALIRGIDTENKALHLVTPIPATQIAEISASRIVLVRGSFDAPEWAYLEDLRSGDGALGGERPWVSRREMVGIESAVWRLRHPPMAGTAAASW